VRPADHVRVPSRPCGRSKSAPKDDREADGRLVRGRDRDGADLLRDADDERAQERARDRTDAAQDRRREDRDDEAGAEQRIDGRVEPEEDAGAARQRAAAQRGEADDALGGQTLDARQDRIVGARAHGDAEAGPPEEGLHEQHQGHRDAEDGELLAADAQPLPHDRARDRDVVAPVVVAADEADGVFQEERDADRRDGECEGPAVSHGPEHDAVHGPGDGARGEAQQLPEQRERDERQREDAAGHEAVPEVLRDRRHPLRD
jgi:hypothetical protein